MTESPVPPPTPAPDPITPEKMPDHHLPGIYLIVGALVVVGACVYAYSSGSFGRPALAECNIPKSEEDLADEKQIEELVQKAESLNNPLMSSDSASDFDIETYFLEKMKLEDEYAAIYEQIAMKQMSRVAPADLISIYERYCTQERPFAADLSPERYAALREELASLNLQELTCKLKSDVYWPGEIPSVLSSVGQRLADGGEFDAAVRLYQCAANQFNTLAMYRIAQVFAYGSDGIISSAPDTIAYTPIARDLKSAYFWIAALVHTERQQNYGVLDTATQFGWNAIGLLDALQQSKELSDKDLLDTEVEVVEFVRIRYPFAQIDKTSVYNHSMRAMLPALEAAAEGRTEIRQSPDDPNTYIVEPVTPR